MKNKITILFGAIIMCCLSLSTYAQENKGIQFVEGKTYAEALAQAKQENKMLFIDCFTTWCGPCKMLSKDVFPQEIVGNFFNPKFVSLKVDMEKGEGVELKKKFEVRAFPTLLFINADGEVVNRIVGACPAEELIKRAEEGMSEKGLAAMQKKYEGGERSEQFLIDYLDVLSGAYMQKECVDVAALLLEGKTDQMLEKKGLYDAFLEYVSSPEDPVFHYVLAHQAEFGKKYDAVRLQNKLDRTWSSYPRGFIKKDGTTVTFDEAKMKAYTQLMKKNKVKDCDKIVAMTYINLAEAQGDWKVLAERCEKYQKKYGAEDMYLYGWCRRIDKDCQDKKIRLAAASWLENRLAAYKKELANQKPLPEGQVRAMPMINPETLYPSMIENLKK